MVILYDNQYNGRFWPCVECWSSFQVATPNGLESEKEDHRLRAAFVCVAASEGTEAQAQSFMEKQWRHLRGGRQTAACDEQEGQGGAGPRFEKFKQASG